MSVFKFYLKLFTLFFIFLKTRALFPFFVFKFARLARGGADCGGETFAGF